MYDVVETFDQLEELMRNLNILEAYRLGLLDKGKEEEEKETENQTSNGTERA
jgi:hypothetical protein